jgi:hypothetical protein
MYTSRKQLEEDEAQRKKKFWDEHGTGQAPAYKKTETPAILKKPLPMTPPGGKKYN